MTADYLFLPASLRIFEFVPLILSAGFHFLEPLFLIPIILGFVVFTTWEITSHFHSPAHSVLVALILHGGIGYGTRARAYIISFTFCSLSFSFQHSLNKKQRFRRGWRGVENWWVVPLLTVITAGFFS